MRQNLLPVVICVLMSCLPHALAQSPANDQFANRTVLASALPFNVSGTCVSATAEPGEPDHAFDPFFDFPNLASNSVWYSWTSTVTGFVVVALSETAPDFDNVLAVYTGTSVGELTEVAAADIFYDIGESLVIRAVSGVTYAIAVDGYSDTAGVVQSAGTFNMELFFAPTPDNDNFADALVLEPSLPTGASDGTTLGASGEPSEPDHGNALFGNVTSNSVWYQWTAPESGTVIASCLGGLLDGVISVYTGASLGELVLVGEADDWGSNIIEKVVFNASAGTVYSIAVDAYSTSSAPVAGWPFVVTVSELPANDDFASREDLGNSLPVDGIVGSAIGATAEAGEPDHAPGSFNLATSSVWYQWTAPSSSRIGVDVESELMDSVIAVYTGDVLGGLVEVAAEDLSFDGIMKRAVFQAVEGTEYKIAVDCYSGDGFGISYTEDLFSLSIGEVPENDDFANATYLGDLALPQSRQGTTLNASSQFALGEPDHATAPFGNLASNSVWYIWEATGADDVNVTLRNIAFDGVLAVYASVPGGGLDSLTEVASADANGPGGDEVLSFKSVPGQEYAIAVDAYSLDGFDGGGGTFRLDIGDVVPGGAYDEWIAGFPSLTGADAERGADPAKDGIPNLVKLLLGLNPTLRLAEDPQRGNYPKLTEFNGKPALEYVVAPENLGSGPQAIRHAGEVSTITLTDWLEVAPVNIGGNTWYIEIDPAGADARFGRLKVSDPDVDQ